MKVFETAVENIYSEREKLLILGLTGRTGSGCTTVAHILGKQYEQLDLEYKERDENAIADKYKFEIIKKYISSKDKWIPFQSIQGSCVILSFIFEICDSKCKSGPLIQYLTQIQQYQEGVTFKIDNFQELIRELQGINYMFEDIQSVPLDKLETVLKSSELEKMVDSYYDTYIKKIVSYKDRIKRILYKYSCYEEVKNKVQDCPPVKYHLYTYLFQKIGNNIRASGNPFEEKFNQSNYYSFAHRISLFIDLIIKYNAIHNCHKTRICIDAIRNVYESNYLKDKYCPYYLLSISTDEESRAARLQGMDIDERTSIDNVEYSAKLQPQEIFYHQNINNCFEMADIHLLNENESNKKYFFITWQLVKYITLMLHPGLITPTQIERCMQLAFNAKYNSGCLSRQVGAVVTGEDYAVKSVGWNEVPKGQISCNLRDVEEYCIGKNDDCYSAYENENEEFRESLNNIRKIMKNTNLQGRRLPYCFKDVYNGYTNTKNQVYTRALHAEENAFLQISKYGGQGIMGGLLFCTASPCELCSKKAYQLGIRTIYYIDPYPGISQKHILTFGKSKNNPQMRQFYGAIGEAYISLYRPLLATKDELELLSGINCKKVAKGGEQEERNRPDVMDFHYNSIEFSLEFVTREIIESERNVVCNIVKGEYNKLSRKITWTGSSYDRSEINSQEGYSIVDSSDRISPYRYQILFNKTVKKGDKISYRLQSHVKDETHMMHPYIAHLIKHPTDFLKLSLIVPSDCTFIKNVVCKMYADMEMKYECPQNYEVNKIVQDKKMVYMVTIENPNLFYSYSIEWDF